MANAAKAKGSRAERLALDFLQTVVPDIVCEAPQRAYGAGRADDIGDLIVFDHAVVQVKAPNASRVDAAVRDAAHGAARQAVNARKPMGVGMTMIPNRKAYDVTRWVFSAYGWPVEIEEADAYVSSVNDALTVLVATQHRPYVVKVERAGAKPLYVSFVTRWASDYRTAIVVRAA